MRFRQRQKQNKKEQNQKPKKRQKTSFFCSASRAFLSALVPRVLKKIEAPSGLW